MDDIKIIFIHGLAAKPPKHDLLRLWQKALLANIKTTSPQLAYELADKPEIFDMAYWANIIPDHIEDCAEKIRLTERSVDNLIQLRSSIGDNLHIQKSGWTLSQIKKLGLNIVDALCSAITIKDDVIHKHLREVRFYRDDQYIADKIRAVLEDQLIQAWSENKRVILVAHSMGTFISYDVLWRFSHRNEAKYLGFRNKSIDMFISMGSPLGDSTLRDFMLVERWKEAHKDNYAEHKKRFYPRNIKSWYNFSACGDIVCHDATLEDDFFDGMRQYLPNSEHLKLTDYIKLFNPYQEPDGSANPHKVYGYLIQPKLAIKFSKFFLTQPRSKSNETELHSHSTIEHEPIDC